MNDPLGCHSPINYLMISSLLISQVDSRWYVNTQVSFKTFVHQFKTYLISNILNGIEWLLDS